jgi:hypothetical protein
VKCRHVYDSIKCSQYSPIPGDNQNYISNYVSIPGNNYLGSYFLYFECTAWFHSSLLSKAYQIKSSSQSIRAGKALRATPSFHI